MGDSSCIAFTGSGSAAHPFIATPIIDPDPSNLLSCGPSGLLATVPEGIACAPACGVFRTDNQTIPNAFQQTIVWQEESPDFGGWWSPANSTKLICPQTGLYIVGASVAWDISGQPSTMTVVTSVDFGAQTVETGTAQVCRGFRNMLIQKNATEVVGGQQVGASCVGVTTLSASTLVGLAAGEFIQLTVSHSDGGDLDVLADPFLSPKLWIVRVRLDEIACP